MKYFQIAISVLLLVFLAEFSGAQIPGLVLHHPANGAIDQVDPLYFSWSEIPDVYLYVWQLDSTSVFINPMYHYYPSDTSLSWYAMKDSATFYWRVMALLNGGGETEWSETWSFTYVDRRPEMQIPANGETDVELPIVFEWLETVEAEAFFISIDDDPDFNSPVLINEWYTVDTFFVWIDQWGNYPEYNKTYYYKLQSIIDMQPTRYTDTRSFTTIDASPVLETPLDDAVDVSIPVTFEWSCPVTADYFLITVDDDPDFTPPLVLDEHAVYGTSLLWSNFDLGTTYHWKVKTYTPYGESDWTETGSFTTHCPLAEVPVLAWPANGSLNLNQPIMIDWDSVSEAYSYWLQVDDASDFTDPVIDGQISWDDRTLHNLISGTTYYWRVCAVKNECGWSEWSPIWSFEAGDVYVCGDSNDDDLCNILDITYLINYLYKGGPPPICPWD